MLLRCSVLYCPLHCTVRGIPVCRRVSAQRDSNFPSGGRKAYICWQNLWDMSCSEFCKTYVLNSTGDVAAVALVVTCSCCGQSVFTSQFFVKLFPSAGECFCLLGPNGAGKSTTINCLTGVLPATAGEALVHGSSITHQGGLDRVRGGMGVCTQFDVLWDNLTGREHLLLFGAIKGLSKMQAGRQADALLDQVSMVRHVDS